MFCEIPRVLTEEQKKHWVKVCEELPQRVVDDPTFMSRIINGNKTWVYEYDPETKQQSSQWKSQHLYVQKRQCRSVA